MCSDNGGVCIQFEQYAHVPRIVSLSAILHIDLIKASTDIVGLFHVRVDIQTAVCAYRQMFVHQSHPEKIGFFKVGTDVAFYLLGVEQHVNSHIAVEDFVVACQTSLCASVGKRSRGCQVVEVHVAVFQQPYVGIGIQTTLTGEEVRAVSFGIDVGREGVDRVFW